MRHYVTLHGDGDASCISEHEGERIKRHALANLRAMRIEHGDDYAGFNIAGERVIRGPEADVARVGRQMAATGRREAVGTTRIMVSARPLDDQSRAAGFSLVIGMSQGSRFAWLPGSSTLAASITVSHASAQRQLSAAIQDVFQDVMLANCASVQAVIARHLAKGRSQTDLYREKADFARAAAGGAGLVYDVFDPREYASFSSLARRSLKADLDLPERASLSRLWNDFVVERMAEHLLGVEEAADLARTGAFHSARHERVAGDGQRPPARSRHEYLGREDLIAHLHAPHIVTRDDAYVLCVHQRSTPGTIDELGAAFGWRDAKARTPKTLRLCTRQSYAKMVPLVRRGLVMPIRLFLKRQV